jgi:hypothetical protein
VCMSTILIVILNLNTVTHSSLDLVQAGARAPVCLFFSSILTLLGTCTPVGFSDTNLTIVFVPVWVFPDAIPTRDIYPRVDKTSDNLQPNRKLWSLFVRRYETRLLVSCAVCSNRG